MTDKQSCTPQSRRNQAQELLELSVLGNQADIKPYGQIPIHSNRFSCLSSTERDAIADVALDGMLNKKTESEVKKLGEKLINSLPNMSDRPDSNYRPPLKKGGHYI